MLVWECRRNPEQNKTNQSNDEQGAQQYTHDKAATAHGSLTQLAAAVYRVLLPHLY